MPGNAGTEEKSRLAFPLFCAQFLDDNRLVVAGGGGESGSGVGNGISVINISKNLKTEFTAELSSKEDAVMSLGILSNQKYLIAGINESEQTTKDTKKNKHFRTFKIDGVETETATIQPISSDQYFLPFEWDDIYQQKTVCSPSGKFACISASCPKKRVEGSFGGEVVMVDLTNPESAKKVGHVQLYNEVVDIDAIAKPNSELGEEYVLIASYLSFYLRKYIPGHDTLKDDVTRFDMKRFIQKGTGIRAIKFLAHDIALVLLNLVGRSGCELLVIHFPLDKSTMLVGRYTLHTGIKAATAMDAVQLHKMSAGKPNQFTQQVVIAVAGSDSTIEIVLLDLEYHKTEPVEAYWRSHEIYKSVHAFPASKVTFSPSRKHHLHLASVSPANTLVVHKIPLADNAHLARRRTGAATTILIAIFSLIFITLLAIVTQVLFDSRGDFSQFGPRLTNLVTGHGRDTPGVRYTKMKGKFGDFEQDMKGVRDGVKDSFKKEAAQGVIEGVLNAFGQ